MEPTDAELLDAYLRGSQDAFAALARRHAGLVYAAARRRVGSAATADDVTQAVFMVLAAKARSVRHRAAIVSWLLLVTRRAAMTANRAAARRYRHERAAAKREGADAAPPADTTADTTALLPLLDDALISLRRADRDALVLRYLERRNLADVGRVLGVGEEAARKRVDRALERLRALFARRGVAVNAGAITAAVVGYGAVPAPAGVVDKAALAGRSALTPLAKGTLSMFATQKTAVLVLTGTVLGGIGLLAVVAQVPPKPAPPAAAPVATTAPATQPAVAPTSQANTITGRISTADGKPAGDVAVTLTTHDDGGSEEMIAGTARTKPDGSFAVASAAAVNLRIAADRPGVGLSPWRAVAAKTSVDLRLATPADVTVTLLGPDGRPAAGVRVWPGSITFGGTSELPFMAGYLRSVQDHLGRWAVTTDADGAAVFHGLPGGGRVTLATDDPRFATMTYDDAFPVEASAAVAPPPVVLQAAGMIVGRVTYADTGRPAAGVALYAQNYDADHSSGGRATTDVDGRYTIGRLKSARFVVCLDDSRQPADRCAAAARVALQPGGRATADLRLVHGGLVTGHVRDAKTGQGLPGIFLGAHGVAHPKEAAGIQSATTDTNGAYTMRVPPGASLIYLASTPPAGYLPSRHNNNDLKEATEVAEGQTVTRDFDFSPDPAPVVAGTVLDDDGRPVPRAVVMIDADQPTAFGDQTVADEKGQFRVKLQAKLALRARAGELATVAPVAVPKRGGAVTLRVSRAARYDADVTVNDEAGWTVPTAGVSLVSMHGTFGTGGPRRPVDANGQLHYADLYKDTQYTVTADAPGYGETQQILTPGKDVTVVIKKADQTIGGTVVDDAGRPVAGVDVGLNGAGIGMLSARTDADGRFTFAVPRGVSGMVYLQHSADRTGPPPNARAKAGDADVRLKQPTTSTSRP